MAQPKRKAGDGAEGKRKVHHTINITREIAAELTDLMLYSSSEGTRSATSQQRQISAAPLG